MIPWRLAVCSLLVCAACPSPSVDPACTAPGACEPDPSDADADADAWTSDDLPAACGAALGATCDDATPCDVGLSCDERACACTSHPCALACFEQGAPDRLRAGTDRVAFLLEDPAASWQLFSVRVDVGDAAPLMQGGGDAALALYGDELFLAYSTDADPHRLDQMGVDGASATELPSWGLEPPSWLTVGENDIIAGRPRSVVRADRTGATVGFLADGIGVNLPTWLALHDGALFYVNDDLDSPFDLDTVSRVALDDGAASIVAQTAGIEVMIVCGGDPYWGSGDAIRKGDDGAPDTYVAGGARALACDDGVLYAVEHDAGAVPGRHRLIRIAGDAEPETLLPAPPGGPMDAASLAVVGDHVVWTTSSGGPWRVLRYPKP